MEDRQQTAARFKEALFQIDRVGAAEIVNKCFETGKDYTFLEELVIATLEEIGQGWEQGLVSLSQVYMSGVICEELIDEYLPRFEVKRTDVPKMAIAVLQDHHALGKRIVYSVLRASGFELTDFGHGLSVDELAQLTKVNQIEILLVSTLMLPSALKVKTLKDKLAASGCRTKIIVGGAPFRLDSTLWKSVGADADGKSASHVIKAIEQVMNGRRGV